MSKRKKQIKRDRFQFLSVDVNETHINPQTGNIDIDLEFDLVNNTYKAINSFTSKVIENKSLTFAYKGENKFRTTTEIPTRPDDFSLDFDLKLKQYKHIIAIDTNTFTIKLQIIDEEVKLGLGIAFVLYEKDGNWEMQPVNIPFITSYNCTKPENENWIKIIELMNKNCQCTDSRKIALVVDSDLGNLEEYNNKLKPIFGTYFLPEEYQLVFASDKVKDNIFNIMISKCHSLSKELIPKFIQHFKNVEAEFVSNKYK